MISLICTPSGWCFVPCCQSLTRNFIIVTEMNKKQTIICKYCDLIRYQRLNAAFLHQTWLEETLRTFHPWSSHTDAFVYFGLIKRLCVHWVGVYSVAWLTVPHRVAHLLSSSFRTCDAFPYKFFNKRRFPLLHMHRLHIRSWEREWKASTEAQEECVTVLKDL